MIMWCMTLLLEQNLEALLLFCCQLLAENMGQSFQIFGLSIVQGRVKKSNESWVSCTLNDPQKGTLISVHHICELSHASRGQRDSQVVEILQVQFGYQRQKNVLDVVFLAIERAIYIGHYLFDANPATAFSAFNELPNFVNLVFQAQACSRAGPQKLNA